MTEAEWMACAEPLPMLEFLRGKANDRKQRLFAASCVRAVWPLLTDERSRMAVEIAERFADGSASQEELEAARTAAMAAAGPSGKLTARHSAMDASILVTWPTSKDAAECAHFPATRAAAWAVLGDGAVGPEFGLARRATSKAQSATLRCIFGNPFRPVALDPAWLAWNNGAVRKVAQAIYDGRCFADLPILADALEDAGCSDSTILAHCRSGGEHVRGCWVVDLLLGKT
jgi:hypothetical protein